LIDIQKQGSELQTIQATSQEMKLLWKKYKNQILERIDFIDEVVLEIVQNRLTENIRQRASREAHSIAGSAGTFGFPNGTITAHKIEGIFEKTALSDLPNQVPELSKLVRELRTELLKNEVSPLNSSDPFG
jgi:HPt (histidine-containing phosphotransfer) domain-containing protein